MKKQKVTETQFLKTEFRCPVLVLANRTRTRTCHQIGQPAMLCSGVCSILQYTLFRMLQEGVYPSVGLAARNALVYRPRYPTVFKWCVGELRLDSWPCFLQWDVSCCACIWVLLYWGIICRYGSAGSQLHCALAHFSFSTTWICLTVFDKLS